MVVHPIEGIETHTKGLFETVCNGRISPVAEQALFHVLGRGIHSVLPHDKELNIVKAVLWLCRNARVVS